MSMDDKTFRLIDVKLGTSTLTKLKKDDPKKVAHHEEKDSRTTTPALGFCIVGYRTETEK
jgi:hypothetical protein